MNNRNKRLMDYGLGLVGAATGALTAKTTVIYFPSLIPQGQEPEHVVTVAIPIINLFLIIGLSLLLLYRRQAGK